MPVLVELDDDVFEALQQLAEPLVDDLSSLLRRVLRLDGRSSHQEPRSDRKPALRARLRVPRGSIVPESDYEVPILQTLVELEGRSATGEVIDGVGEKLADRLGPLDREALTSGELRWRNRAQFVRLKLVRLGEMRGDSPRGIWEITDAGRRRVQRH